MKIDVNSTTAEITAEIDRNIAARSCGECSACCYAMGVDELKKESSERCAHERQGGGCEIYETRPASCRDFYCLWRMGVGRLMERPDRSGIVLTVTASDSALGRQLMVAREAWPGAFDAAGVAERLDRMATKHVLIKVRANDRKLIGPERLIQGLRRTVQLAEIK